MIDAYAATHVPKMDRTKADRASRTV